MKKFLIFMMIAALFGLSACSEEKAAVTTVTASKADEMASDKIYPSSVTCAGYTLKTEIGVFFVSADEECGLLPAGSFARMKPAEGVDVESLVTGEGIKVTVITVEESYPPQMKVYSLEKTGETFEPDAETVNELDKLGWKMIK